MFSINDYKHKVKYDLELNKHYFKIGYSYKHKGPSWVWYRLSKNKIDKKNIKRRCTFKPDYNLHFHYIVNLNDYVLVDYDIGHLANDADFDYSYKSLKQTYLLSNTVPQNKGLNRGCWLAAERYTRYITRKLKYVYVINLLLYDELYIGNKVHVPKTLIKIVINKKNKFLKIFKFDRNDKKIDRDKNIISYEKLMFTLKDNH